MPSKLLLLLSLFLLSFPSTASLGDQPEEFETPRSDRIASAESETTDFRVLWHSPDLPDRAYELWELLSRSSPTAAQRLRKTTLDKFLRESLSKAAGFYSSGRCEKKGILFPRLEETNEGDPVLAVNVGGSVRDRNVKAGELADSSATRPYRTGKVDLTGFIIGL